MRVQHVGHKIRGFYRLADYALRWGMIAPDAQMRLAILDFWQRHGLAATMEAFKVSRRTLYLWRAKLKAEGGNVAALVPGSTAPKRRRQRQWPAALVAQLRRLRTEHPNLGKEKLHPFLARFAATHRLPCPSPRTIGRLMADAPDKMRRRPTRLDARGRPKPRRAPRTRKPKHFRATRPGHCIALDSIEERAENQRRYIITCTDLHSHFSWAWVTRSHASAAAAQFFRLIQAVFPFAIEAVLTDNGSEFQRHFASALATHLFTHWHTYPKSPKMNAHCERFNRTLQDEFLDYHHDLLFFDDLTDINLELLRWLSWYNLERPHRSLTQPVPGRKTPRLLSPVQFLHQFHQCNMYWPHTFRCVGVRRRARSPVALPQRHENGSPLMSKKSLSYAAATIALLVSTALFAQAPPIVVITFADPTGVPLDMWSSVAAGLMICAAAFACFRHRGVARFGRVSAWLAVIAAAAGAVIGASRLDVIATAQAIVPPALLLLTSSPASIGVVGGSQLIQAQNAAGRTITLLSVTLVNPLPGQSIELIEGPNCIPGLVLPASDSCFVQVQQFLE